MNRRSSWIVVRIVVIFRNSLRRDTILLEVLFLRYKRRASLTTSEVFPCFCNSRFSFSDSRTVIVDVIQTVLSSVTQKPLGRGSIDWFIGPPRDRYICSFRFKNQGAASSNVRKQTILLALPSTLSSRPHQSKKLSSRINSIYLSNSMALVRSHRWPRQS
jgi:hypothetical protein